MGYPTTWEDNQFFDPSDLYRDIRSMYAKKYDISEEEIDEMLDRIAYHESKGDPVAVQQLSSG